MKLSIKKDNFKLTLLPTIQYYKAHQIFVFVWVNYELQIKIK